MKKILFIDNSCDGESLLEELDVHVIKAQDVVSALGSLAEEPVDAIVLAAELASHGLTALRAAGHKAPAIILFDATQASQVPALVALGAAECVVKPCKDDELRRKVEKVLTGGAEEANPGARTSRDDRDDHDSRTASASKSKPASAAESADAGSDDASETRNGRAVMRALIVDARERVHAKLGELFPEEVAWDGAVDADSAEARCSRETYRLIFIDMGLGDETVKEMMKKLHREQPDASFVAIGLRTVDAKETKDLGFDSLLHKPFAKEAVDEVISRYAALKQELVTSEENVITLAACQGKRDLDRYFRRLGSLTHRALEDAAAECFEGVIIDMTEVPLRPEKTPKLIRDLDQQAKLLGLGMLLVASSEAKDLLKQFADTSEVTVHETVAAARAAQSA